MQEGHNILIACHRHIGKPGGGGELSMSIIAQYLHGSGHSVMAWVENCEPETIEGIVFTPAPLKQVVKWADIVLTWGRPAKDVARVCIEKETPYLLCVRWWRNVCDVRHIGDLSTREIDKDHVHKHKFIFHNASAVITNNKYSAEVIERFYGTPALVSYVPVLGISTPVANPNGYILAISPNKGIGEKKYLLDIAVHLPSGEEMLIVNAAPEQFRLSNIKTVPYQKNMFGIFKQCKMMIQPIYYDDICGTLRATIEAMQHGLPVIANNRCGMWEKIPENNLVSYAANTNEWVTKINEVNDNWQDRSREAVEVFEKYDTPGQLAVFEREIEKALTIKI